MADNIDITINETVENIDIVVNPNLIEVNITRIEGASVEKLVPYIGATDDVNLGSFDLTANNINVDVVNFDLNPIVPTTVGSLYWDNVNKTLSLIDGVGATTLQIGQEERVLIKNTTGATLTDGQIVYITGATGNLPSVSLASALNETTSAATLGMVTETITNGSSGFVTITGLVNGLNTLAFNEGDILWLSNTAGEYTNIKPTSPSHLVLIGYVTKKSAQGSVYVKIQNTQELNECSDVLFGTLSNNDLLIYESSTGLWKNKQLSTLLGGTSSQFVKGNGSLDSTIYATQSALNTEITNRTNADSTLTTNLNNEISRATTAEGTITTNLNNEISRATAAELTLTNAITTETSNRISGDASTLSSANSYTDTGLTTKQNILSGLGFVKINGTTISYDNEDYYPNSNPNNYLTSTNAASTYIPLTQKGVVNGVASLDSNGLVPSTQLPSYVDDVLEYANLASFPATGVTGKIYVDISTNKTYRWSGTVYVYITSGAVDSVNGYTGVINLTKSDIGLSNVDNTADVNKNVLSATKWTTARTLTIGNTGKLVDGTANVSWSLSELGAQPLLTNPVTGNGTTNYLSKWSSTNTLTSTNLYVHPTFGYLGISTTNPRSNLEVNTQAYLKEIWTENGLWFGSFSEGAASTFIFGEGSNTSPQYLDLGVNFATRVRIADGGNVLINTTTNNGVDKLQVNGSASFSSSVTALSGGNIGGFEIIPSPINGVNLIGKTGSVNDFVLHNGLGLGVIENPTGTQNIRVRGSGLFASTVTASNGTLIGGTGTANYLPKFTGANALGNSLIYDNGTNVGIGIASPSGVLHTYLADGVNDNVFKIQQGTNGFASAININANSDSGAVYNYISSNTTGGTEHWRIGSGATTSTLTLSTGGGERMRITSEGNVGIGTTSPEAKLDVVGDIKTSGSFIVGTNGDTSPGAIFSNANYGFWFKSKQSSPVLAHYQFGDYSGNPLMIINPSGNVLIGTTSDNGYKLNVNGNLSLGLNASAPTGVEGAIYYNSTTKKHYGFDGTTWNALY